MGKHLNKVTGMRGELLAVKFLKKQKYKILETNFTTVIGEIDIIALYKDTLVFVEVKTRLTKVFGLPREAVGSFKQNKIRLVATSYLKADKRKSLIKIKPKKFKKMLEVLAFICYYYTVTSGSPLAIWLWTLRFYREIRRYKSWIL